MQFDMFHKRYQCLRLWDSTRLRVLQNCFLCFSCILSAKPNCISQGLLLSIHCLICSLCRNGKMHKFCIILINCIKCTRFYTPFKTHFLQRIERTSVSIQAHWNKNSKYCIWKKLSLLLVDNFFAARNATCRDQGIAKNPIVCVNAQAAIIAANVEELLVHSWTHWVVLKNRAGLLSLYHRTQRAIHSTDRVPSQTGHPDTLYYHDIVQ